MKTLSMLIVAGGIAVAGLGVAPAQAGCLSGAAIGGAAGHFAGHHGLLGAAAGCAIGHHRSASRRDAYREDAGSYRSGPDRQMYGRDAYRDER